MGFALGVELTKRCNFTCGHCMVDAGRARPKEASTRDLVRLLGEAARCGVTAIGWSGGEALVRKDVEELTAAATALGLQTGLATNGYLATRPRLEALKQAGLRTIQISLDGPDAARAGRYRTGPRDAFARAYRAIEESASVGLHAYMCALLVPESAGELEEMIALASKAGAAGLRYATYLPVGRAEGQCQAESAWAIPAVGDFLRLARERSTPRMRVIVDCPAGPLPGMRRYACGAGRETAYITADGQLFPCTSLMHADYRVGNVFETPLGVLMSDGRMFKVLHELASQPLHGHCTECSFAATCCGGCPGRTLAVSGSVTGESTRPSMPDCLYRLHSHPSKETHEPEAIGHARQAEA